MSTVLTMISQNRTVRSLTLGEKGLNYYGHASSYCRVSMDRQVVSMEQVTYGKSPAPEISLFMSFHHGLLPTFQNAKQLSKTYFFPLNA